MTRHKGKKWDRKYAQNANQQLSLKLYAAILHMSFTGKNEDEIKLGACVVKQKNGL